VPKSVSGGVTVAGDVSIDAQVMYIPLEFWFCRNPGLALPLIALQYHEVKSLPTQDLMVYETDQFAVEGNMGATLFVDYIYLSTLMSVVVSLRSRTST
jgi:hypothetical protein